MVKSKLLVLAFISVIHITAFAQANRYMVFFKDKASSTYSIDQPLAFLSQRSVTRRMQQGIQITVDDVPVNENYIQGIEATGANVFFRTRWMNGALVQCEPSIALTIQSLPYVDHVDLVAPDAKLLRSGRRKSNLKTKNGKAGEVTDAQLHMIGIDEMQEGGYKGEGVMIAIFDSGFPGVNTTTPFQHLIQQNKIIDTQDFVYNSDNVFQYDEHGTEVLSIIAAYQPGIFTGGAYEANYQLYVTEEVPTEYRVEEYNWLFAAEHADSAGVDVINSSLGYYDFDDASMNYAKASMNGNTAVVSKAAQMAADRGMIIVCSAGNEGNLPWKIITAPADVEDVLAIASVNTSGVRSSISSIGPSADGRIKPDVAAQGVGTSVIKPNGAPSTASGTSLSAPLITSLVAGVWQRYPQLTSVQIMDAIRKSASQASNPDNLIGYGIPNFRSVVNYLEKLPQENLFSVFPNPILTDTVIIQPNDPNAISACHVELLSAQGQRFFEGDVSFSWLNRNYKANIGHVAPGMYFMNISFGEKKFTYKLIKI